MPYPRMGPIEIWPNAIIFSTNILLCVQRMPTACLLHAHRNVTACRKHVRHAPAACRPHLLHVHRLPYVQCMSIACPLHVYRVSTLCLPHVHHMPSMPASTNLEDGHMHGSLCRQRMSAGPSLRTESMQSLGTIHHARIATDILRACRSRTSPRSTWPEGRPTCTWLCRRACSRLRHQ